MKDTIVVLLRQFELPLRITRTEFSSAYRKLCKTFHPDTGSGSISKMQDLNRLKDLVNSETFLEYRKERAELKKKISIQAIANFYTDAHGDFYRDLDKNAKEKLIKNHAEKILEFLVRTGNDISEFLSDPEKLSVVRRNEITVPKHVHLQILGEIKNGLKYTDATLADLLTGFYASDAFKKVNIVDRHSTDWQDKHLDLLKKKCSVKDQMMIATYNELVLSTIKRVTDVIKRNYTKGDLTLLAQAFVSNRIWKTQELVDVLDAFPSYESKQYFIEQTTVKEIVKKRLGKKNTDDLGHTGKVKLIDVLQNEFNGQSDAFGNSGKKYRLYDIDVLEIFRITYNHERSNSTDPEKAETNESTWLTSLLRRNILKPKASAVLTIGKDNTPSLEDYYATQIDYDNAASDCVENNLLHHIFSIPPNIDTDQEAKISVAILTYAHISKMDIKQRRIQEAEGVSLNFHLTKWKMVSE